MSATLTKERVLVADDSGLMRRILTQSLTESGFEVVGQARDGDEALALWRTHQPDAMTLDLAMPGMDGIGVLRELRRDGRSVPVVVVSAFSPAHGARAVDALAEGAFDLVAKPAVGAGLDGFAGELAEKVHAAAGLRRRGRTPRRPGGAPAAPARDGAPATAPVAPPAPRAATRARTGTERVVLIASSTGGPRALAELIPALPAELGLGSVIVQHMPPGFTASLAARLDRTATLTVAEARTGDVLEPGRLLMCPGGSHLRIGLDRRLVLSDAPPVGALRPRADLTIDDAVAAWGSRLLLVVLTGMGRDGEEGAAKVKAAGGRVIVEDESTCTVYGMPRAVVEAGLADRVVPLHQLADVIAEEALR
ncbi:chemotaxis-specific protein-glutamate methyltransferase CheB [Conexibacter sp. W3-3-2]|uniref:Protein-glutamate methylesterase/protein-glutamine glutaminase n=1 Tax=Paraconexibacter algicola TaxID=2133960 RepID=A0A2T4UIV6_9ACTN|nr:MULTISPECIES: chemotaxis-specific protein-glutamate methyltransferase CheB [Solirubrobacterales]MTD45476.1 chemotaxis-specific protein-glutamate methyltransferase CheB [Conexibacter sp. W3-3-2]PTL59163.1 chemotaxis response regulator protein-glutamate methylesterase [Paraconexibacter algicola]